MGTVGNGWLGELKGKYHWWRGGDVIDYSKMERVEGLGEGGGDGRWMDVDAAVGDGSGACS